VPLKKPGWQAFTFALIFSSRLSGQISGRVVVGGGTPPQNAFVTVHCDQAGVWAGFTDKRGEFIALPGNTASGSACQVSSLPSSH
jgi:hypothetical protein